MSFVDSGFDRASGRCFSWFQIQIRVSVGISLVNIDQLKNAAYISNEIYLRFPVYSGGGDLAVSVIGGGNDAWNCQGEK